MPSNTRGKRNPTPGAPMSSGSTAPIPPPTDNDNFLFVQDEQSQAQFDDGDEDYALQQMAASAQSAASSSSMVTTKLPTAKKSADAKWTSFQEAKLVAVAMREKAYIKTDVTVQKKFEIVAAKLSADRDFSGDAAFAGKEWQAFQKKFKKLMDNFKARYAFDQEGANLSGLDGSVLAEMPQTDSMLYSMALELEQADERRKLLTEKEKERNKSCLRYEAAGLAGKTVVDHTPNNKGDNLEDDLTTSGGSKAGSSSFDGFLSRIHEADQAMEMKDKELKIEEAKLKTQEAKTKALELKLQLQRKKNTAMMLKGFKRSSKKRKAESDESSGSSSEYEKEEA